MITRYAFWILALVALIAGTIAWRYTELSELVKPAALARLATSINRDPSVTPAIIIGGFVLGSMVMVPVTGMILAAAILCPPIEGFVYSMVGSLVASCLLFFAGALVSQPYLQKLLGQRFLKVAQHVQGNGLYAVVLMRILPVAPFTVVNLVCGGCRIRLLHFLIGSVIGLLPGIALFNLFGSQLRSAFADPKWLSFGLAAGVGILLLAFKYATSRLNKKTTSNQSTS